MKDEGRDSLEDSDHEQYSPFHYIRGKNGCDEGHETLQAGNGEHKSQCLFLQFAGIIYPKDIHIL